MDARIHWDDYEGLKIAVQIQEEETFKLNEDMTKVKIVLGKMLKKIETLELERWKK